MTPNEIHDLLRPFKARYSPGAKIYVAAKIPERSADGKTGNEAMREDSITPNGIRTDQFSQNEEDSQADRLGKRRRNQPAFEFRIQSGIKNCVYVECSAIPVIQTAEVLHVETR